MNQLNGVLDVVVLTIGTDPEITAELLDAVNTRTWSTSAFHFDSYLSSAKRPSIAQYISSSHGCIAFVDYDRSPEQAAESSRFLTQAFAGKILTIAVGKRPTSTAILNAMRAGCSEFLPKHSPASALDVIFDRFATNQFAQLDDAKHMGTVLAVLGAKGGVGATSLAVHLSAFLAERQSKRTLLIDQQQLLGHACVYLGIDGEHCTFAETIRNLKRMDSELLHGFVAHHSSSLEIMSSPDTAAQHDAITALELSRTLQFLRAEYGYVVLDCDRRQPEMLSSILESASEIFLVATPDVAAVRDLSRTVDALLATDHMSDKLRVVINRYDGPHAIAIEQIEKALKWPVSLKLPDGPAEMIHAANAGKVLTHSAPGVLASALARWADDVAGTTVKMVPKQKEQRVFSRWRQVIPSW